MRSCAPTFAVSALTLVLFGAACAGPSQQTTSGVDNRKVVSDALDRYNNAKRSGTPIDLCVQARVVAAAYLQVKDEENYNIWKETEATDCGAVGMRPQG